MLVTLNFFILIGDWLPFKAHAVCFFWNVKGTGMALPWKEHFSHNTVFSFLLSVCLVSCGSVLGRSGKQ